MDTALTLSFKPSKQLMLFYILLLLISAIGISVLPSASLIKFLLVIGLLMLIGYVFRRYALLASSRSIVELRYQPQRVLSECWQIRTKAGSSWYVKPKLTDCYVSPYLTVLSFQLPLKQSIITRISYPHSLIILPDSLPKDDYRRLRVLLNWVASSKEGG